VGGNSLDKTREIFDAEVKRRPRIPLSARASRCCSASPRRQRPFEACPPMEACSAVFPFGVQITEGQPRGKTQTGRRNVGPPRDVRARSFRSLCAWTLRSGNASAIMDAAAASASGAARFERAARLRSPVVARVKHSIPLSCRLPASGTRRTSPLCRTMSAFGGKADIVLTSRNVRF
jgi:hypothetical protein